MVQRTKTIPPIVGVFFFSSWGTKVEMGWFALRALAQRIKYGKIATLKINARKKLTPARNVMYWNKLICATLQSQYSISTSTNLR